MKKFLCLLFTLVSLTNVTVGQKKNDFDEPVIKKIKDEFLFEEKRFFAQCHASTLEETSDGILLASWFAGSHEGNKDVVIYGARYLNGVWETPQIWADGKVADTTQYPCWNPVLFRGNKEEELYLYYKVGPNPREWWGMVKISDDGGQNWGQAKKLPDGILGPIKNRPLELSDGSIISPSSVELTEDRWVAHVEISTDRQKSWKVFPIDHETSFNAIQPSVVEHDDGRVQVLCRSKEGIVTTSWSTDKGRSWSKMGKTNLINPNSGTDAIRVDDIFLIVYNPDIPGKDWWEGRTKLRLAYSRDGLEWTDIFEFEDEDKGEFSYPTIMCTSDDLIHVTYTYNRKSIRHFVLEYNRCT